MTDRDWSVIDQLLAEGWGQAWDERKSDAYRLVLDGCEPAEVALALNRIIQRGGGYRPSIAEVVAAINTDAGLPTWAEACRLLFGPGSITWNPSRLDADDIHDVIKLFVRSQGLGRLQTLPLEDDQWGHVERRKLGEEYEQFVEGYQERKREGRALEALGRASRGELERLDPLAALKRPRLLELASGDSEQAAS